MNVINVLLSSQTMTLRCHSLTGSWSWTSLAICPAFHGTSVWETASCHLCPPPDAQPPWRRSSGPSVQAETPQPAWTPSHWSGITTTT